ncbi:MAG: Cell division protein FtsN [Turneriella sp.]|nr:Cell division protein FtsN [Turneriella sp.]
MKEFYVMNLDMRRIAILVGGALVALGLTLFLGMAIGRSQSAKSDKLASDKDVASPVASSIESADKLVLASGPSPVRENVSPTPVEIPSVPAVPSVPETKSEIPLKEDPLVSGPPRNAAAKQHKKQAKKTRTRSEVSGEIDHSKKHASGQKRKKRKVKSVVSEDVDEELALVAGTAKAQSAARTRYTIQVAAFKRPTDAQNLVEKLKSEGIRARSEKSGDYYLVTVGRTKSKSKLDRALARLKELDYNVYIRKLSPPSDAT